MQTLQTVLLDAADADAIGADVAAADAGSDGGKSLSEADVGKRRHVTLMDWGAAPVVEITVRETAHESAYSNASNPVPTGPTSDK